MEFFLTPYVFILTVRQGSQWAELDEKTFKNAYNPRHGYIVTELVYI